MMLVNLQTAVVQITTMATLEEEEVATTMEEEEEEEGRKRTKINNEL